MLKDEGYIQDFKRIEDNKQGLLRIYLKYGPLGRGRDHRDQARLHSRAGGSTRAPRTCRARWAGWASAIVSTSKGILSDRQCRQQNVGGEVLCTVC